MGDNINLITLNNYFPTDNYSPFDFNWKFVIFYALALMPFPKISQCTIDSRLEQMPRPVCKWNLNCLWSRNGNGAGALHLWNSRCPIMGVRIMIRLFIDFHNFLSPYTKVHFTIYNCMRIPMQFMGFQS